jgi:hypothetical protein
VTEVPEGHLCCGSAGTYNILQPEIAAKLRDRKVANIESTAPQAIATGNIGCITQIGSGTAIPILHTIELLDWAYGGRSRRSWGEASVQFPSPSWGGIKGGGPPSRVSQHRAALRHHPHPYPSPQGGGDHSGRIAPWLSPSATSDRKAKCCSPWARTA